MSLFQKGGRKIGMLFQACLLACTLGVLVMLPTASPAVAATHATAQGSNCPVTPEEAQSPKTQMRAVWIATVANIDWPTATGETVAQQQQQFITILDKVHSVLDPLFANGTLNNVYETFTPNWDNTIAQSEAETTLANQNNNIQIIYVANDGMAGGVITALKAISLNGRVLVTGQDATSAGLNAILLGFQNMTVYKPIAQEASSTGHLVQAIYQGTNTATLTQGATTASYDGGLVPSILDQPVTVDRTNIASTVIADGFLTRSEICQGVSPGTDGVC